MSILKTTYIQHPSAESPAIELHATDGAVFSAASFAADAITSGTLDVARIPNFDAAKITSGVLDAARVPLPPEVAGIGSNVVQATKLSVFSSTSRSVFQDVTGLSVTITPSSASSKILVVAQLATAAGTTGGSAGVYKVIRGATDIYRANADGAATRGAFGGVGYEYYGGSYSGLLISSSIVYLDSPATTSATTYKVQVLVPSAGTAYVNRPHVGSTRGASSITAIEVAA